jgi:hypothetical protein
MAFYKNPEEMYKARAKRFKSDGDRHWAQAKSGEGDWHFGKAKEKYNEAEINLQKANDAKGKDWK